MQLSVLRFKACFLKALSVKKIFSYNFGLCLQHTSLDHCKEISLQSCLGFPEAGYVRKNEVSFKCILHSPYSG